MTDSLETSEAEALKIRVLPETREESPVLDAIALLIQCADELKEGISVNGVPDWKGEPETKAWHDRHLRAAEAVSNLSHRLDVAVELAAQYAETIEAQAAEIERLRVTLALYASRENWEKDQHGVERIWLEPDSSTRDSYHGFELAAIAITKEKTS